MAAAPRGGWVVASARRLATEPEPRPQLQPGPVFGLAQAVALAQEPVAAQPGQGLAVSVPGVEATIRTWMRQPPERVLASPLLRKELSTQSEQHSAPPLP